jgi:hypothetical protein
MTQIPISIPANPMQELQKAIAAMAEEGWGGKFSVLPLPQPGQGCRERFLVQHSYANRVPISKTEVAITIGGRVLAFHPKFRWDNANKVDELNDRMDRLALKRLWAEREGKPYEEIPAAPE